MFCITRVLWYSVEDPGFYSRSRKLDSNPRIFHPVSRNLHKKSDANLNLPFFLVTALKASLDRVTVFHKDHRTRILILMKENLIKNRAASGIRKNSYQIKNTGPWVRYTVHYRYRYIIFCLIYCM
jgi:hypothetical protein